VPNYFNILNNLLEQHAEKGVVMTKFNFGVRHPRCVGSITNNLVYYTYSRTQLYFTS